MRFVADAMLGRLARWLRLLGYDTLYQPGITDRELLGLARRDGRVILTRDTHFLGRGIEGCLFVRSDDVEKQLLQVMGELGLSPSGPGRCANCNGVLRDVMDREEVSGSVPEYVYLNFRRFMKCAQCGNVYWEGSQFQRIRRKVRELTAGGGE
jgi:uncharacterized protein with PIN domain